MYFDELYKRTLHQLDYYNYQHGFIVRHFKQEDGWNDHLEKCRQFILKSFEIHKPEIVTVLGSGWLLELPLAEMVERVGKINLVDIVHPPEVIKQIAKISTVNLLTEDITGGLISEIWKKTSRLPFYRKPDCLKEIVITEYKTDYDPGMVISLNILSQLEVLPVKYLMRKSNANESELRAFRHTVQKNHLDFLRKNKSVLITDFAEIFTDRKGVNTENETVITELPQGILREDWTWDFDLKGSDFYRKRSVLKVAAIIM
jgi:hypothetical protein